MARSCRVVVDTSIVWHVAFKTRLAGIVSDVLEGIGRHCTLIYTEFNVEEVKIDEKLRDDEKNTLIETMRLVASYRRTGLEKSRVLGRYGKWVEKLGRYDILHAYAAKALDAFLLTGDWPQAKFAMEVLNIGVFFIPLRLLARVYRNGQG